MSPGTRRPPRALNFQSPEPNLKSFKFVQLNELGALSFRNQISVKKVGDSYVQLEKRIGAGHEKHDFLPKCHGTKISSTRSKLEFAQTFSAEWVGISLSETKSPSNKLVIYIVKSKDELVQVTQNHEFLPKSHSTEIFNHQSQSLTSLKHFQQHGGGGGGGRWVLTMPGKVIRGAGLSESDLAASVARRFQGTGHAHRWADGAPKS